MFHHVLLSTLAWWSLTFLPFYATLLFFTCSLKIQMIFSTSTPLLGIDFWLIYFYIWSRRIILLHFLTLFYISSYSILFIFIFTYSLGTLINEFLHLLDPPSLEHRSGPSSMVWGFFFFFGWFSNLLLIVWGE